MTERSGLSAADALKLLDSIAAASLMNRDSHRLAEDAVAVLARLVAAEAAGGD